MEKQPLLFIIITTTIFFWKSLVEIRELPNLNFKIKILEFILHKVKQNLILKLKLILILWWLIFREINT